MFRENAYSREQVYDLIAELFSFPRDNLPNLEIVQGDSWGALSGGGVLNNGNGFIVALDSFTNQCYVLGLLQKMEKHVPIGLREDDPASKMSLERLPTGFDKVIEAHTEVGLKGFNPSPLNFDSSQQRLVGFEFKYEEGLEIKVA